MQFKDIIGQAEIKQSLLQSVHDGHIPHARLFYGSRGVGKLQLALAYAQYLACENPTDTDSCGHCAACLQYQKLQHPDLNFVFPIIKKDKSDVCDDYVDQFRNLILSHTYFDINDWYRWLGAETKQGLIYENESGEILRKLSLKAYGNGYKVMVIWLPEKMNLIAANKLLKILEEPPEKTIFLLVAEEPERLLPTILSRVQQIKVPRLNEAEIATALRRADEELSIEDASSIAHIAAGSWLRAKQIIAETDETTTMFGWFVNLMRNAWLVGHKKDYNALFALREWSEEMASASLGRERQKAFLQYCQHMIRENYIANFSQPDINYMTKQEADFSKNFSRFVNANNITNLINQLQLAERQIEQNGNARMIFFDLALQMIVMLK